MLTSTPRLSLFLLFWKAVSSDPILIPRCDNLARNLDVTAAGGPPDLGAHAPSPQGCGGDITSAKQC